MSIDLARRLTAVALTTVFLAACGGPLPDADAPEETETAPPAPVQAASLADIFPEGLGRSLVLDSCGACHAAACSAIGQRPHARWDSLKEDHRDKVPEMAEEDYEALFAYLSEHFNDSKPEPAVPPVFLEGGCTPF